MRKTYKPLQFTVAFAISVSVLLTWMTWSSCQPPNASLSTQTITGQTMGTTYSIKFYDEQRQNLKPAIDSFLLLFNQSASTYIPTSTISQLNQQSKLTSTDPFLLEMLEQGRKIYQETNGAFDPTVMPLVNYWSFGYDNNMDTSAITIDSLVNLVGFDKITWQKSTDENTYTIEKAQKQMQLDFSAIAKGYGVDLVGQLLEQKGIESYMVEIGGETRARGQKPNGFYWKLGIDQPIDSLKKRQQAAIIELKNQSLATSGNYRNFYIKDGKKVAHTINPETGYSELSNLLSASVIAPTCLQADAYATALMVMGLEKAQTFAKAHPELTFLLIYYDEQEKTLKTWQNKPSS